MARHSVYFELLTRELGKVDARSLYIKMMRSLAK